MEHAELIQNLRDAYAEEENLRNYSFLEVPHLVAGVEIGAMTLRQFCILEQLGNPYICGGLPTEEDAAALLWVVSKEFCADSKKRLAFLRRLKFDDLLSDVSIYIRDMFLDAPSGGGSKSIPAAASAAYIIHRLAETYGWDDEAILDKSMPRLHQYLKLIRLDKNPKAIVFNPLSDKAKTELIHALNEKPGTNN